MKIRKSSLFINTCLIGLGVLALTYVSGTVLRDSALNSPLNPFGIKGSPYGEVFAMAMQGPIDREFHGAMNQGGTHHHRNGENCDKCPATFQKEPRPGSKNLRTYLASLQQGTEERTNPKAASEAHRLYLRRKTEDKLRFAYELDPSHYANYTSLHFFLTEPQLGTRPELTPSAAKLGEETIEYCLRQNYDPRPALTAAAAASNILELMFNDHSWNETPKFTIAQMKQYLGVLDFCINRYVELAREWDNNGNWELLSPMRIKECDERFHFIGKFRESAVGTISRLEGELQVAN